MNMNDWLIDWLREYMRFWDAYHHARLKREAFDRWLFFGVGLIVGLAVGAAIAGAIVK